jgi:hypothetical protein
MILGQVDIGYMVEMEGRQASQLWQDSFRR